MKHYKEVPPEPKKDKLLALFIGSAIGLAMVLMIITAFLIGSRP